MMSVSFVYPNLLITSDPPTQANLRPNNYLDKYFDTKPTTFVQRCFVKHIYFQQSVKHREQGNDRLNNVNYVMVWI